MNLNRTILKVAASAVPAVLAAALMTPSAFAQEPTPGYNNKIPEWIMTPDKVETRVGTLEFFDGIPTEKTAALLYDNLDYLRGVETFLNGMSAASLEAIRRGQASLGAESYNQVVIFDQLMDSNPLFLTGNTDTVYCSAFFDLKKKRVRWLSRSHLGPAPGRSMMRSSAS
jgi:hypothetical protein